MRSCSSTATRTPDVANARAHAVPVRPPPTITTSVVSSPFCRGYAGRRLDGNVSKKYGTVRIRGEFYVKGRGRRRQWQDRIWREEDWMSSRSSRRSAAVLAALVASYGLSAAPQPAVRHAE